MALLKSNLEFNDSEVRFELSILLFKEDGVFMAFAPALDLTGYGKTKTSAINSFKTVLEGFIEITREEGTFEKELLRLGWERESSVSYTPPQWYDMVPKNDYLKEIFTEKEFYKKDETFSYAY